MGTTYAGKYKSILVKFLSWNCPGTITDFNLLYL